LHKKLRRIPGGSLNIKIREIFMKRKLAAISLIFTIAALCFSFSACSVAQSGKSAYEIAVENGFVGTEQAWEESLKENAAGGGIDIYDLFDAYLAEINPDATFAEFLKYFSVVGYYDSEYAAAEGIRSAVSVYSTFSRKTQRPGQSAEYSSGGAGVVYKIEDGYVYIITNYHVIYDRDSGAANGIAENIEVYSYGHENIESMITAEFIGGSITKDIAVLKAKESAFINGVKAVTVTDSDRLCLGEKAVAIGNPSGEGISVTSGVISVDSEEIEMEALDSASETVVIRVIRTDTPINGGNSGGGLFNMRGELIGITNAKTVESGVENIGYAIPAKVAVGIADCVIENDSQKCVLGISVSAVSSRTEYDPKQSRVEIKETIEIASVSSGTLADGKLQSGDIVFSVRTGGGAERFITRLFHLSDYLYNVRPGDTVNLTVSRGNEVLTVALTPDSTDFKSV
jgi:serine protease Do